MVGATLRKDDVDFGVELIPLMRDISKILPLVPPSLVDNDVIEGDTFLSPLPLLPRYALSAAMS